MNWDRAKEIGTHGGCGLLALAICKKFDGSTPLLRYDTDGDATHAAALVDGTIVHLGDNDTRFIEVPLDELKRACREDFDPTRVNIKNGEIKQIVKLMFGE